MNMSTHAVNFKASEIKSLSYACPFSNKGEPVYNQE